jgi:hypothetical protein
MWKKDLSVLHLSIYDGKEKVSSGERYLWRLRVVRARGKKKRIGLKKLLRVLYIRKKGKGKI